MKRNNNLPLTETVFYILLSLLEPAHGYLILQKIELLSNGDVKMAAGTLYGALENLVKLKFIESVKSNDPRRKVYVITDYGKDILRLELERISHLKMITEESIKGGLV